MISIDKWRDYPAILVNILPNISNIDNIIQTHSMNGHRVRSSQQMQSAPSPA